MNSKVTTRKGQTLDVSKLRDETEYVLDELKDLTA